MKRKLIYAGLAAGTLAISGLAAVTAGASASPARDSGVRHAVHACNVHVAPGHVTCNALVMTGPSGKIVASAKPLATAFTPQDIQKAYNLTGLQSGGRTVAIVDAYGYPSLESDLATFRSTYGLPACTKSNGCLTVMDQNGGQNYPPYNSGWALEQALDVDAVSAACPDCKILVVQGNQSSFADLETAVNTASRQAGVVAISNSYSGGNQGNQSAYNHPGIAITASTGDSGYAPGAYPASDTHVVAVGGTSVFRDGSGRGYSESVWSGAGSGCGTNQKPKWQNRANTTCSGKASSDVSAAADPSNGGLNIYFGGFEQVGGTSESSPIIAAVYALSGNTKGYPAKYPYKNAGQLYDITSGSNGSCGVPVCVARAGWDGPTGMGTPHGVAGF